MSLKGRNYYEKHFLYSNPIVQLFFCLKSNHTWNNQLVCCTTISVCLVPFGLHQFYEFFTSDLSLESSLDILQGTTCLFCNLICYCFACIQFVKMRSILAHIKYDYDQVSDEAELEIFKKYMKQTKSYTYCFVVIFHLWFIGTIAPSLSKVLFYHLGLIEKSYLILPFPTHNVLNPGLLYYSLFIYQTIAMYIFIVLGSVCWPSYLSFVQHACCQLSVLRLKISQPFRRNNKFNQIIGYNKKRQNEFEWTVDIIKRYARVTKFVYMINSFSKIGYIILITLLMFLVILGFISMYQISKGISNTYKLIERSCYITNSIISGYINFYVGQRLIDHNTAAFDELCQVPFYDFSTKLQKLLLFVIARSMRPCELSIGGLFISSHTTFSGLMQKAFSFATVYYNIR